MNGENRRVFRRNVAIYILHREGLPIRDIAEVFRLPRERVAWIVDRMRCEGELLREIERREP